MNRNDNVRRRLPLSQTTEFFLCRSALYWSVTLLFLVLGFLPVILMMLTKVMPAPNPLLTLGVSLCCIPTLLGAVYMVRTIPPSPGWRFSRQPLSSLALAEVIMVDTALITRGRRCVQTTTQPIEPAQEIRKRPGVLSLAAAITYTAHLQPPEDEAALLAEADRLGLRRENLLRLRPAESDTQLGTLPGVVVRDGKRRMAYFCGGAGDLADICSGIQDSEIRLITDEDRAAIRQMMMDLSQQGCRVLAYALSDDSAALPGPVFLGMLALQDEICEAADNAVRTLLAEELTVLVQPISEEFVPPLSLSALRRRLRCTDTLYAPQVYVTPQRLDTRALRISPADHRHQNFDAPIMLAREWFASMESWLSTALWIVLPLLVCCIAAPLQPMWCVALAAMLLPALATTDYRIRADWRAALPTLITGGALRLFLLLSSPGRSQVMCVFCLCTALLLTLHVGTRWQSHLACAVIFLALTALCCLLYQLSAAEIGFGLLGGALAALLSWRRLSPQRLQTSSDCL